MSNSVSKRLERNIGKIMGCWEERAKKEVPAALHQESLALRDSLPEYLTQLVVALSKEVDRTEARIEADRIETQRVAKRHGHERAGSLNYTLAHLVYEYHILRQVLCDVLEEEEVLSPPDRELIVTSIEQAVNDAASQYSETLQDIQKKLTHVIAHDLRGPITAAKTGAQLILKRPDDANHCLKTASRIVNSMNRLDAMIHDLLDASRLRAGEKLSLHFAECDLDVIARQVVDEENFTHANRFRLESNGRCLGYWNEDGVRRMLENLTTNAAKFSPADTPITVVVRQSEDRAFVSVHNEGAPIPAADLATLFQQFRRLRSAETKVGWGLGLTIVKGMAEAHHGTVQVESVEGKGTTFRVDLPKDFRQQL